MISNVTLQDIRVLEISNSMCKATKPCNHPATLILHDGRTASILESGQIWSIVSALFASNLQKKINPCETFWSADQVHEHFKEKGWVVEPSDVVLNKVFAEALLNQPKFDIEDLTLKVQEFTKGDHPRYGLANYIADILKDEKFKKCPKDYVVAWNYERGYTQEYRLPEDQALDFFTKYFKLK